MTNLTHAEALNTYIDNEAEEQDFKASWRLSKKIRNDVLSKKWEFDGSFDKYEPANLLLTCVKWILLGPHKQDSTDLAKRTADIDISIYITEYQDYLSDELSPSNNRINNELKN